MRALGPGSVSSFMKITLDVVFVALWIGIGGVGLMILAAVLLSANPNLMGHVTVRGDGADLAKLGPAVLVGGLLAALLYMVGVQVIVQRLRRIFVTLMGGDPFHPDNVRRFRVIGLMLACLELGRYGVWVLGAWLPGHTRVEPNPSLTAWFSVLVVFVLAEVFREGARLRGEAELTI